MLRILFAACSIAASAGVAFAEEKPFAPASPPPTMAFVHAVDADKAEIMVVYPVSKPVAQTRYESRERVIDGRKVTELVPITVTTMVTELQMRLWSARSANAIDAKGKALTMKELAKRLKKNDPIVIAASDTVDPAYLKLLKEDAVVLLGPPMTGAVPVQPRPAPPRKNNLTEVEQRVFDLVNAERKKEDLSPLRPNALLMQAARDHSKNMAKQDMLKHELDDKGPADRLDELGYKAFGIAENVAAGQRTPAEAVESWMNSEPHKANILGEKYAEAGVGLATTADGKTYWTIVFAAPAK